MAVHYVIFDDRPDVAPWLSDESKPAISGGEFQGVTPLGNRSWPSSKSRRLGQRHPELCRKHGISSAAFYARKSKFGGMEISEMDKMRSLEDKNRRLKKLLADSALESSKASTTTLFGRR
jgi:putative transposase